MIQSWKARLTTPKQPFFIFVSFFWPRPGKGLNPKALYLRPLPLSRKKEQEDEDEDEDEAKKEEKDGKKEGRRKEGRKEGNG